MVDMTRPRSAQRDTLDPVGEMLRIVCERCGRDRVVFHGVGMAGLGETLGCDLL
jgi:ribosomal protein S27E